MNQTIKRLMSVTDETLTNIEQNMSARLDLSEYDTKDEIIARQSAIIDKLTDNLKEITKNL